MPTLHVLRVFVSSDGSAGNPLGVFLDGSAIPPAHRQAIAADLAFPETVFVEDRLEGRIRIHTPAAELGFAGHPSVGTAWLLGEEGSAPSTLHVPAGDVPIWREDGLTWVRARAAWVHAMTVAELPSAADVEALAGPPVGEDSYYAWAWIDRTAGRIRSRYFAPGIGIAEDEATGAAAVVISDRLGRGLQIEQGRGSRLHTRPGPRGTVELGGRCALVERREYVPAT